MNTIVKTQYLWGMSFILLLSTQLVQANADLAGVPPHEICALCHSIDGNSHMAKFPKLAGQSPEYLNKQIRDFLSGARTNDGGQMQAIVTEIQDSDIIGIVVWFSNQTAPPAAPIAADRLVAGRLIYEAFECDACHGVTGTVEVTAADRETLSPVPHLSAQHADYLLKQMNDFTDGARLHPVLSNVQKDTPAYSDLTLNEKTAVADFLAGSER